MHGLGKIRNPQWAVPGGDCAALIGQMSQHTGGPYHDFITNIVMPNVTVFAQLVAWGETLVGVSLLLGLLTRLGGLVGVVLALNYWAAKGDYAHLSGYTTYDIAAAVLSFISLALPTGKTIGLDGLMGRRPRIDRVRQEPALAGTAPP